MKTILKITILLILTSSLSLARTYCFVFSPSLDSETKASVTESLMDVIQTTRKGDSILVVDGDRPKLVCKFIHSGKSSLKTRKGRMKTWRPEIAKLARFLKKKATGQTVGASLHIPKVNDFLHAQFTSKGLKIDSLVLIGSPLHIESKEEHFSMKENRVPNDNHIQQGRETSIYGLKGKSDLLTNTQVFFVYPETFEFESARYEEAVQRFWSLWFASCGGQQISSFGTDVSTTFLNARKTAKVTPRYSLKPDPAGPFMLQLSKRITQGVIERPASQPPIEVVLPPEPEKLVTTFTLTWKQDYDLDMVFVKPTGTVNHRIQPEPGTTHEQQQDSKTKIYTEKVTFLNAGPIDDWVVKVNIYDGRGAKVPEAILTITQPDGNEVATNLVFRDNKGSKGVIHGGDDVCIHWEKVILSDLLKDVE